MNITQTKPESSIYDLIFRHKPEEEYTVPNSEKKFAKKFNITSKSAATVQ